MLFINKEKTVGTPDKRGIKDTSVSVRVKHCSILVRVIEVVQSLEKIVY